MDLGIDGREEAGSEDDGAMAACVKGLRSSSERVKTERKL